MLEHQKSREGHLRKEQSRGRMISWCLKLGIGKRTLAIVTVQAGAIQLTQILDEVNRAIVRSTEELSMEVKRQLELRHL
jgi:hypothetical protein